MYDLSPSFLFPNASVSWNAVSSDEAVFALTPKEIAIAACNANASFLSVRPSSRSFTKWVAGVYFKSPKVASEFADEMAASADFPFCLVRRMGDWDVVSVPVWVSEFEKCQGLPCIYISF